MSEFTRLLQYHRERRGLSQSDLARQISKSPQFISALEHPEAGKLPSVETLAKIVTTLSGDEQSGITDYQAAVDIALAGLGLHIPFPVPVDIQQEMAGQTAAPRRSEIWIISDILAEGEHRDYARITAENIVKREMRFMYFVPFGSEGRNWQRALKWLSDEVLQLRADVELLNNHVSVFQLSNCAFTSRLRVTNPRGKDPSARYSLGARGKTHMMFYPVPTDVTVKTVGTIIDLLTDIEEYEKYRTSPTSAEELIVGDRKQGFIHRLFPKRSFDAKNEVADGE